MHFHDARLSSAPFSFDVVGVGFFLFLCVAIFYAPTLDIFAHFNRTINLSRLKIERKNLLLQNEKEKKMQHTIAGMMGAVSRLASFHFNCVCVCVCAGSFPLS